MQKKLLAAAIASAMCVPVAAQAVEVKVSGHVNRVIRFLDDGVGSDVQHVDHGGSRTRIRWTGSEKVSGNLTAGVNIELAVSSAVSSSAAGGGAVKDQGRGTNFGIRHSSLWFSGNWGRVDMGLTFVDAADLNDLSGTSAMAPNGSNLQFSTPIRNSATGASTGILSSTVANSFTFSRFNGLRYTSPKLGPVQIGVDTGNNEQWAAKVNLDTSFAGAKFAAGVGYRNTENDPGQLFEHWDASASILFSQGTSLTLQYVERDFVETASAGTAAASSGLESNYWLAKVGHKWGNNLVSLSYYASSDMALADDDATEWELAFVHAIPKPGVQLYAIYSNTDYDHPTVSTEDIDMFMVGSRIFF